VDPPEAETGWVSNIYLNDFMKLKITFFFTFVILHILLIYSAQQWPQWAILNIAHRGGIIAGFPENTLSAYRRAISLGVDVIEIDLRGTRDGEIVVIHDASLDRTTNGTGNVSEHTLAELKQLDAGNGERIPTYQEVLQLINGTRVKLLLDIKVSPVLDKRRVVRLTQQNKALLDVIVGVRSLEDLCEFRELNPNLRTLGFIGSIEEIKDFIQAGVDIIRLWPGWIKDNKDLVKQVQQLGKPVWVTAGDASRKELEELIQRGVNGILCDAPEILAKILSDIESSRNDK
jgi:glycerophosphoryl diester phosphodiesterase